MVKEAAEHVAGMGRALVKREGWLGFVLISGVLLLAFYVWTSHTQTERITSILQQTQQLHIDTLEDRKTKTAAIELNTDVMRRLGMAQERSADNLQGLVNVVASRIEHDKITDKMRIEQAERFMAAIKDTQAATEAAQRSLEALELLIKQSNKQ